MHHLIFKTVLIVVFVFINGINLSQKFQFKQFNIKEQLSDPFIYTMVQDNHGYLIVGTGEGLGVFDGVKFQMYYTQDGISENFVSSLYLRSGDEVWMGHKNGGVTVRRKRKFKKIKLPGTESIIKSFTEVEDYVLAASQSDGISMINKESLEISVLSKFENVIINEVFYNDGKLLIGTADGLLIYDYDKTKLNNKKTILKYTNVVSILSYSSDTFLVATESDGVYLVSSDFSEINKLTLDEILVVKDVTLDEEDNILISTINGGLIVYKDNLVVSEYNVENGLKTNAVNITYVDREGSLWIGTYGEGLFKKDKGLFTYYLTEPIYGSSEVLDISSYQGRKVFGKDNFVVYGEDAEQLYADTIVMPIGVTVSTVYTDVDNIWIGTEQSGLWRFNLSLKTLGVVHLSDDILSKTITDVVGNSEFIWIGTVNGVFRFSLYSEEVLKFDIASGLSHNNVNALYYNTKNKNVYVGCKSSKLSIITGDKIINKSYFEDTKAINVSDLQILANGNLALATAGDGLFIWSNDEIKNISTTTGLASNFCYAITEDENEHLWVAHNGSLTRYNRTENLYKIYNEEDGVGKRFNRHSFAVNENELWLGSEDGALRINTAIDDINLVPPIVNVLGLSVNGKSYKVKDVIELPYDVYDINVEVQGLSLSKPGDIKYSYFLEGLNKNWSKKSNDGNVRLSGISDGEYILKIVAYNSDGQGSSDKVQYLKLSIATPFWKKVWFWAVILISILLITVTIIYYRERRYRINQEQLEAQLVIRTKEVTEQKEELEHINKDITDSINYARRIQEALLPSKNKMNELFEDGFVMYMPRDIVSGDFYWITQANGKIILACSDCTGHGVPGAFMSILGMQMLREITDIKKFHSPNEILDELNREIYLELNSDRSEDEFATADGMDICITNFDLENKKLIWSSAMRPLVLYRNGEREYLRGDRMSIGGELQKSNYSLNELELKSGDMLYMFSDGFPDQFGQAGKKLKSSGMFKILDACNTWKCEDQRKFIKESLIEWKGSSDQTDDIIVMGIRI